MSFKFAQLNKPHIPTSIDNSINKASALYKLGTVNHNLYKHGGGGGDGVNDLCVPTNCEYSKWIVLTHINLTNFIRFVLLGLQRFF